MPRKRMIHPAFFTSATLARLDVRACLTFAGLWIYCDDTGRGEDDATFVVASIYPRRRDVTTDDVEDDLAALAEGGQVCRYRVGGVGLLHIPSWHEHQRVSHPTPSKLPPCPSCEGTLYRAWYRDDDTATARFRDAEKAARRAQTAVARDSGETREDLANDSAQCSSVQSSSVKGTVREFVRRSAS
jgi:hypothetical protein